MALIDPFTTEGAKQIAAIAGQQPAPISAAVLSAPSMPTLPQPQPTYTPAAPSVPKLSDIFVSNPTQTEQRFADISKAVADTGAQLAGESAYRTQQEGTFDLVGKRKTVTDLITQLNNLKTEAEQIPLQLQNDATGRGITAGGLAPIQTSQLRENTIRQLGVSAMLNAANGNLAIAQDQVDSAVKAKFDPLKAELAAQKAQLDALQPLLSIEEKKQADKQAALLAERSRLLDKQEQDQKIIYNVMLEAAKNGADSVTLQNIYNAESPDAAIRASSIYLRSPKDIAFTLSSGESRYVYNPTTKAYELVASVPTKLTTKFDTGVSVGDSKLSPLAQAVIADPSYWNNLTQTAKTAIIPELKNAGFTPPANLSASQQDDIATMNTVKSLAQQLMEIGGANDKFPGTGPFGQGTLSEILTRFNIGTKEGQQVRDLLGNIKGTIAKLRGGTSFTPNEEALLNRYTPTINDSGFVIAQKLKDLTDFIEQKQQRLLEATTVSKPVGVSPVSSGKTSTGLSYTVIQ